MEFTQNEKEVLKLLLENCRMSDTEMANRMGVSAQAAGKIRKKLESEGVIRGYSCDLDFDSVGINTFAIVYAKILPDKNLQEKLTMQKKRAAEEIIKAAPGLLMLAEPIGSDHNYVALFGFRDQTEMENFIKQARIVYAGILEDKRIDTFSAPSLLKFDKTPIFRAMLESATPENPALPRLDKIGKVIKAKKIE